MRKGMEWDEWYHVLCITVAKKSQCLSRQIGAILVRDKAVIAQGYNGPPRGVRTCDERWLVVHDNMKEVAMKNSIKHPGNDGISSFENIDRDSDFYKNHLEGKCPRYVPEMGFKSGEGLEWCVAGHAERNALINAARLGIKTDGCKLYMDCGVPCTPCLVEIINAGVEEIIVSSWHVYDQSALYLLKESDLNVRVYQHLCNHENFKGTNNLKFLPMHSHCVDCGCIL